MKKVLKACLKQAPYYLIVCSGLVMTGCGEEPSPITEEEITQVSAQPLSELLIEHRFYRPAVAMSLNDSTLSSELTALVSDLKVDVGDTVGVGDPLVELNCTDEKNRLAQAKAQLSANEAAAKLSLLDYQRAQKLYKQKSLSKQELDRRQSEHTRNQANQRSAQAALKLALSNSDKCVIAAPFSGVVIERMANVGQLATTATPMVRLVDTKNIEVSAHLTVDDIRTLEKSTEIAFLQGKEQYPLTLKQVTLAIDSERRTQEARLQFKNDKPLPGSTGELIWQHPLLVLPAEYLSRRNGDLGVLFITSNSEKTIASFHVVENAQEGQPAPIVFTDTFNASTQIITGGRFSIDVDDEIQLVSP